MDQILVYSDSLAWGIVPDTRQRLPFDERWPGVLENTLIGDEKRVRVIEDCLNGRRTVWNDPFKPGRNGAEGLAQRIESHVPLALVILALGTNDFQFSHPWSNAWSTSQGIAALVAQIRGAPIEPGMSAPPILIVCPPPIQTPRGAMAMKFAGAEHRCVGLGEAYREVASAAGCHFFDAGSVISASRIDGIHLDRDQHLILGRSLARLVASVLR